MDILRKNQEISSDFAAEGLCGRMNRTQDIVAVMLIIVRLSYLGFDRINNPNSQCRAGSETMDTSELYARGLRRRKKLFGDADVEKRMAAAGEFGAPLQNIINAYVYGDIWERSGLSNDIRSLVMLGITAASNKPAEFRV